MKREQSEKSSATSAAVEIVPEDKENTLLSDSERRIYRIVLRCLLMAVGVVLALLVFFQILRLLVLVFGAIVVAVLLRALADPISARLPLGSRASALISVFLVFAVLGLLAWVFGSQISSQFSGLSDALPGAWSDFRERISTIPGAESLLESLRSVPGSENVLARIGTVLMAVGGAIADLLLVTFGAIFLAAQPDLYRRGFVKLFPAAARPVVADALTDSGRSLKWWLLGQLVSMIVVGTLTWFGLMLIGMPSPLALGIIAGLAEIIPFAGPVLAAIPGLLIALLHGPELALWALLVYLVVQQLEGNLIQPVIQRKAVSLPPALTLFGLFAAGLLFGVLGFIFAAPLLVVAYVLVNRLYIKEALEN